MKSTSAPIRWLRHQHRGVKCAILLVAAWTPLVLPQRPILAGVLMLCATSVFLIATDFGRPDVAPETSPHDSP